MPVARPNPLGKYLSHAYNISWYIASPEQYNAFINGSRRSHQGAGIIAQSGGVSQSENRAPGLKYDYYIDNLKIKTMIGGPVINTIEFAFDIIEPMGFSFVPDLKKCAEMVRSSSSTPGMNKLSNAAKHTFILGLRFIGYDSNLQPLPPEYETYYDFTITEFKFKIDGKATVYHITGMGIGQTAYDQIDGRIINNIPCEGKKVGEILGGDGSGKNGLLDKMNKEQQDLLNPPNGDPPKIEYANEYKMDWSAPGADEIRNAELVDLKVEFDMKQSPGYKAEKTQASNPKTEKQTKPNFKNKTVQFRTGTSVAQAIESVINQSEYIWKTLRLLEKNREFPEEQKQAGGTYKSFKITSKAEIIGFDNKKNAFSYRFSFGVQPYLAPTVKNPYVADSGQYPGPHKVYEYWFTGKNTEVLKYEQAMDNLYFLSIASPSTNTDPTNTRVTPTQPANASSQGVSDRGLEAQNATHKNLVDNGNACQAKITVYGDPDFLMNDPGAGAADVVSKEYASDGRTANPNAGEVFIEIKFKEAIDYNSNGLLDLTDDFVLWENTTPGTLIYKVLEVNSTFSRGQFTQELSGVIATFPKFDPPGGGGGGGGGGGSFNGAKDSQAYNASQPNGGLPADAGRQQ